MSATSDITGHGLPGAVPLMPVERVTIREVADGAGPSHLIPIGDYLLVVDPWAGAIHRYAHADMAAPPRMSCLPRSFAPWRSRRIGDVVRVIAEPYGPEEDGSYHLRSRAVMTITAEAVEAMPAGQDCGFPIDADDPPQAGPSIDWRGEMGPGAIAWVSLGQHAFATIAPEGGANAEIYAVRRVGDLALGRSLLWWSEVDGDAAEREGPGHGGRVTASQYVGIFAASGGAPIAVIRVQTAAYAPLAPDAAIPVPTLLVKPGFEYVAGTTDGGRDMLWVMAAETKEMAVPSFMLLGYAVNELADGARATVSLVEGGSEDIDRNDPAAVGAELLPQGRESLSIGSRAAWFDAAQARLHRQVGHRWRYPRRARERPCGGGDGCSVGANDTGALGVGEAFGHRVIDKIDDEYGAWWMRPRQLIGVAEGAWLCGVPYSIGGFDLAETFAARLASSYDSGERDPPPIGHIREGLEWHGQDRHYPLGIDCSALVARIFGVGVRSTAEMVAGVAFALADGRTYQLPRGPDGSCTEPVRHLRELQPGDVLLRDGHIVIYAGTMQVDGGRALRVFEASARTGRVCESVYDPTLFDGWWMLRMDLDGEDDRPRWIGAAACLGTR